MYTINKATNRLRFILNNLENIKSSSNIIYIDTAKNHWYFLHNYPVVNKYNWSVDSCKDFFDEWEQKIPNRTCRCLDKWIDIKTVIDFPEKYNSPELFFKWSIDAHNEVNKKLDKPIMSYEEAKQIYGF